MEEIDIIMSEIKYKLEYTEKNIDCKNRLQSIINNVSPEILAGVFLIGFSAGEINFYNSGVIPSMQQHVFSFDGAIKALYEKFEIK